MNPTLQKTLVFSGLVPDSVNRTGEYRLDASGKGVNVCRVLTQLGKEACHLTQLGGALRPLFLELCEKDGLRIEWVESSSPIRFCYTLIDKEQRTVTELVEESEKVGKHTGELLFETFSKLIPDYSVLIISGTKAKGFPDSLIPEMVIKARLLGCRVILDVRGIDLHNGLLFGPEVVKPNLFEFVSTFAPELLSEKNAETVKKKVGEIWAELYKRHPFSALVLTRGTEPIWYAEKGELAEYAFESVEPLNTTGSGDAFTAGLAAALEEGASLAEALAEGVRCGALNATLLKPGVIRQEP